MHEPGGTDMMAGTRRTGHGASRRAFTIAIALALALIGAGLPAAAGAAATTSGTVAFESNRAGNMDIFTMTGAGAGQAQLTSDPADDIDPAWSPDGRKIAFASRRGNDLNIWVMNADGTGQVAVTSGPASDRYPTWAPDGTRIAFRRDTGAQSDIYVVGANGVAAPVTTGALADQPAWSPDGTRIAFVSTRDGNDEVYVMNADGTGQRNLSANAASDRSPHWSPDSARIIFRSLRLPAEGRELFVMAPDGSAQSAFASSPGADRTPSFAPDGSGAVFATGRFGNQDIASAGLDGTGLRQLTFDPASDDEPVWTAAGPAAAVVAPGAGGGAGAGAGATVARDLVAPKLTVKIARRQHLSRAIRVIARCSEGCTLRVSASVRTRGRRGAPRSRVYIRKLTAGRATPVRLKLSRSRLAVIRRSLRRGTRVQATVTAIAADAAGNLAPRVRRGTRLLR
jgi:Tol biopolymer transport system component